MEQIEKQILIVDDETELLEITYEQISLNFNDIVISLAKSGNEASALIKDGKIFDLIVSDYNMPDGNGTELLNLVTSTNYPSFFILYTSHLKPDLPEKTNKKFLGVVEKFNFDDLFECISKCIPENKNSNSKIAS